MPIDSRPQPPQPPDPDRVIAALRHMTKLFAAFVQDVHKAMRPLLQSEQGRDLVTEYNRRLAAGSLIRGCRCPCGIAHPARRSRGICLGELPECDLVSYSTDTALGRLDVLMCAPCAAATAAAARPRRPWRFVPGTMTLEPEDGRPVDRLTAEEVERQQMPPCPSCGATIELDWLDVHTTGDPEPMYIPGAWSCPADPRHPRAGERTNG